MINLKLEKNQTQQMCLEAVKENCFALRFVKEQTSEITFCDVIN